ncbi:hypothetical protein JD844_011589 [Phrynosoma platyrhinos]|uniref:Uncharacterized protein n=1 Tax=Phrynosoma platyrhinos TaxID=52577 RepID=A0ABQ7TJ83_PHRPL|nr:hypothetical protein JD844_011589 [Phrynosoma platyrhinos]
MSPQDSDTEHAVQFPLFGYNVYPVKRISIPGLLMPCFIGVNQEQIIVVDGKLQNLHCRIPLKEVQRMKTLRPLDEFGSPGLEVNYGSPENPKTIWFELKQVIPVGVKTWKVTCLDFSCHYPLPTLAMVTSSV